MPSRMANVTSSRVTQPTPAAPARTIRPRFSPTTGTAHAETGQSLEQLGQDVEQGHGVIVDANAGVLWNDPQYVEGGAANHAVTVTGVARDPQTGNIQGFYINDSGDGKSAEFVSAQTMTTAWQDTGGTCVVTDAVHTLPQGTTTGGQQ